MTRGTRPKYAIPNSQPTTAPVVEDTESILRPKRTRARANETRKFIVWDGEGAHSELRRAQDYVLLGCYDGAEHRFITNEHLRTSEMLEFIIDVGRDNPDAWHVGFAFGYDVDMILHNLPVRQFEKLRQTGVVYYGAWRIEHLPGKWFRVTEYGPTHAKGHEDKTTVTIFDIWGFFQSSFVNALKTTIPEHELMAELGKVEDGKRNRSSFTFKDIDFITEYWKLENQLFHALINRLRDMLYRVGLRISSWHGPGALANFAYKTSGIESHKADCGSEIYAAARIAYAGGRFECFHIGAYRNAYGYDINSAYPNAIAKLPSLSEGSWELVSNPTHIVEFGVYHVRLHRGGISGILGTRTPSPLFHRDGKGNVSFPWQVDGWYWTPEVHELIESVNPNDYEIVEGWEYTGWTTRPFGFVAEMYNERRRLKALGDGSQMALKTCLNSLYGKMAQRAGWERAGGAPKWHQLEWAGYVTSYTRAMLFSLIRRIPWEKLIAVETDGIYTTATPAELGIVDSKELGGWEVSEYEELIYLQSGVYAKRDASGWSIKFRGLDRQSFGETDLQASNSIKNHCVRLRANTEWPDILGTTTRFIGYRNALFREKQNQGPMKSHHCVWETTERALNSGNVGKRRHRPDHCRACRLGKSAIFMPHDTVIFTAPTDGMRSVPHYIPWLDDVAKPEWLLTEEENEGLLRHA